MKVEKVETFLIDAGWRSWIFVKTTAGDFIGWSEVTDSHGSPKGLVAAIEDISSLVIGKDVFPERVYWDLYKATRQAPGGLLAKAIGGIENSLWDLKGKQLGVPVYELLGGPTRTKIPCYWSHCGTTRARAWKVTNNAQLRTYEDVEALAKEVVMRGFSALKTNIVIPGVGVPMQGFQGEDHNIDKETIRHLERLMDHFSVADVDLILDLNFNFVPEGYIKIAKALEPFDLLWIEIDCFDPKSLAYIRTRSPMSICSGENLYGSRSFRPYFEHGSMDIASVDVLWNGLSQSKRIADMAETFEVNVAPHNYYSHLATFMAANFCATIPNVRMLEVDVDDVPWKDELTSVPQIRFGDMTVPLGPGWGCEVNEDVIRKHGAPITA